MTDATAIRLQRWLAGFRGLRPELMHDIAVAVEVLQKRQATVDTIDYLNELLEAQKVKLEALQTENAALKTKMKALDHELVSRRQTAKLEREIG